jgi:hypothetical protein
MVSTPKANTHCDYHNIYTKPLFYVLDKFLKNWAYIKNGIPIINNRTGRSLSNTLKPENSITEKMRGYKFRSTLAREINNKA